MLADKIMETTAKIHELAAKLGKVPKQEMNDPLHRVFLYKIVEVSLRIEKGEKLGKIPTKLLVDVLGFNAFLYYHKDGGILSDQHYDRLFRHLQIRWQKGFIPDSKFYFLPKGLFEQDHTSYSNIIDPFIGRIASLYLKNPDAYLKKAERGLS